MFLDTATDSDAGGMHSAYFRPGVLRCKAVRVGRARRWPMLPTSFRK